MRYAILTASMAVLFASTSTLVAQDGAGTPTSNDHEDVYINVDGAAVQIPIALAAEACGLDEAAVMETAATRMEESGLDAAPAPDATASADEGSVEGSSVEPSSGSESVATPDQSNETVTTAQGTADPSTSNPGDEMLALAVCEIDVETAGNLGIPQANEIVTE